MESFALPGFRKVGWQLAHGNPFSFVPLLDLFQETEELGVCCRDITGEKVAFPTSSELLKAIHSYKRVNALEKARGLYSNWGFAGH